MKSAAGRKVTLVGGAGFIGSHLVPAFRASGAQVAVLDHRARGVEGQVERITGDLRDSLAVARAVDGARVVVHLASSSVPGTSNECPRRDVEDIIAPTIGLLEACVREGVDRFVFFSSGGAVYGRAHSDPVTENHATSPLSAYGVAKLAIEKYVEMFGHVHGLPYTILRPGNPYGERQPYRGSFGFVATALGACLDGRTLTIWGDGTAARDFFYVGDLASACVRVVERGADGVFNVAGGRGETLSEIVDVIRSVTGRELRIRHLPARSCDPERSILDVTRLRSTVGWMPTVELEEGLRRTWEWIQSEESSRGSRQ